MESRLIILRTKDPEQFKLQLNVPDASGLYSDICPKTSVYLNQVISVARR